MMYGNLEKEVKKLDEREGRCIHNSVMFLEEMHYIAAASRPPDIHLLIERLTSTIS